MKDRIKKDRIEAMKSRDAVRKNLLDYILGQIETKEKSQNAKGDIAIAVIKSYVSSVTEVMNSGNVSDEYKTQVERELQILSSYLPKEVSEEEVKAVIQSAVTAGANKKGIIMKAITEKFGAAADMKKAALLVDAALSQ